MKNPINIFELMADATIRWEEKRKKQFCQSEIDKLNIVAMSSVKVIVE